jgi:hypothetical protein
MEHAARVVGDLVLVLVYGRLLERVLDDDLVVVLERATVG